MKLSVSLPDEDVTFLDEYARETDADSRSAVIQYSIKLLRHHRLKAQYAEAMKDWVESEDAALWDGLSGEGLDPEEPWWEAPGRRPPGETWGGLAGRTRSRGRLRDREVAPRGGRQQ